MFLHAKYATSSVTIHADDTDVFARGGEGVSNLYLDASSAPQKGWVFWARFDTPEYSFFEFS